MNRKRVVTTVGFQIFCSNTQCALPYNKVKLTREHEARCCHPPKRCRRNHRAAPKALICCVIAEYWYRIADVTARWTNWRFGTALGIWWAVCSKEMLSATVATCLAQPHSTVSQSVTEQIAGEIEKETTKTRKPKNRRLLLLLQFCASHKIGGGAFRPVRD